MRVGKLTVQPLTSKRTLEELRQQREDVIRVAAQHGASNVRVFGSIARGEDDEKSDIDLIVDFDDKARGFAYVSRIEELRQALTGLLGRDVDVMDSRGLRDENLRTPRLRKMKQRVLGEVVPL